MTFPSLEIDHNFSDKVGTKIARHNYEAAEHRRSSFGDERRFFSLLPAVKRSY